MSTALMPAGAPLRAGTNVAPGSQTTSLDTTPGLRGRIRLALILGLLAIGIQLALAGNAFALGQISYGDCVSSDGSSGMCGATNGLSLSGAGSAAISAQRTTQPRGPGDRPARQRR